MTVEGTVLIVDDDASFVQTVHDVLEIEGIRGVAVGDPQQIGTVVASIQPRVMLLDLMLAVTSGVELAAELREGPFAHIPRIAISSSPFLLEIAAESGLFDHVLQKPVEFDEMVELVAEYMVPDDEATEPDR